MLKEHNLHEKVNFSYTRRLINRTSYLKGKTVISKKEFWDFSANDYLGLASDKDLLHELRDNIDHLGMGSTGSRLLSGQNKYISQLESSIASWLGKETSLVFNSGYQCNVGVIPTIYDQGDLIIADKFIHASLIDGIRLSGADFKRFGHLNYKHCEDLLVSLRAKYKRVLLLTESVFSMDGDVADLKRLVELKKKYNCDLMVDEAHAIGVIGQTGQGYGYDFGQDIDFLVGAFGKAFASSGAYVALSQANKALLVNQCRSFIYSTALPLPVIYWNLIVLNYIQKASFLRDQLADNVTYFRQSLLELGLSVLGESQIVPVLGASLQELERLKSIFSDQGIWVPVIKHPTVNKGAERFRFSISVDHTKDILDDIVNIFKYNF